jgi:hypothetical protein
MARIITKAYPVSCMENDVVYARKVYCYTQNNHSLVKWVKRQLNKRFRRTAKQEITLNTP